MRAKTIAAVFAFLLVAAALAAGTANAETLSWNAVTTYTDGSSVGSATVTYQAYWSSSSSLTNLHSLGSSTTSTSSSFSVDSVGMPRGSIVYLSVKATVGGVDSQMAAPLSWNVPAKTPSAPTNLRMN